MEADSSTSDPFAAGHDFVPIKDEECTIEVTFSERIQQTLDSLLNAPPQSVGKTHKRTGPTTDYGTSLIQWTRHRGMYGVNIEQERPSYSYIIDMLPPAARPNRPADTIPCKHLHSSLNKIKHPINVVKWTPEGRRLLTASSSGEFTLWNGMSFNFETIQSAHDSAIRSVAWSNWADFMISADQKGIVKYWQPNFNNVNEIQAHDDPVRELAFAPTDKKFITCSDDSKLKVWDFDTGVAETTLTGHGWDVRTCDWDPHKGLVVSGSKDHTIKLWDPKTGQCLTTLHSHKNTIHKVKFEPSKGLCFATCARDNTARIFDIRMMRDVLYIKGHDRDIITLTWHPVHRSLLSTAGADGSIHHYLLDEPNPPPGVPMSIAPYDYKDPKNAPMQSIYPAHKVPYAHEQAIWSLDWHPVGHILASGSNDRVTRFWTRARPGDTEWSKDRYHIGDAAAKAHGSWSSRGARNQNREDEDQEQEDDAEALVDQGALSKPTVLPGLPGIAPPMQSGSDPNAYQPQFPGMGNVPPPLPNFQPPSGFPAAPSFQPPYPPTAPDSGNLPDVARLAAMLGGSGQGQVPPPPLPPFGAYGQANPPFPPPPNPQQMLPGMAPPQIGVKRLIPQELITHVPSLPPNSAENPHSYGVVGNPDRGGPSNQHGNEGVRKRGPLPSQKESLREQMKRRRPGE